MDLFTTITPYHWFALGLLLLTAEMLGAAGFPSGSCRGSSRHGCPGVAQSRASSVEPGHDLQHRRGRGDYRVFPIVS